ncbi:MAG: hypothetical protein ACXWJT_13295, partial [Xanthobacteraceae bacterium]
MAVPIARRAETPQGDDRHDELVRRAEALIPQLREQVTEAEKLRKMPPASVEAIRKAGLFKVLQPRRIGGFEQSLRTHIDTIVAVSRGCSATGWCMGVMHA